MENSYTLLTTENRAKRARFVTPHGTVQTPLFMNVATVAAIKGALSAEDLQDAGCQIALCNTYHLHLRPGEKVVKSLGGLRSFMAWDGPVLTDSGGFQVFSLSKLRKIKEEGVYFSSHIDGRKIFMGPEESMDIQQALGATIAMAFDECPPYPAERSYILDSVARTTRWLHRCKVRLKTYHTALSHCVPVGWPDADEPSAAPGYSPMLFGINQGGTYEDIRIQHAKEIAALDLPGYAIGGLAVGESHSNMYQVLEAVVPHLPADKPTYLMGVGTPENILEAVARGVDFFDCVMPARNGRHGHVYTNHGKINLLNAIFERDAEPIDPACGCKVCKRHSKAYIRHLFKAKEMLAMRLCVMHNLYFYNHMMGEIREAIEKGRFEQYRREKISAFRQGGYYTIRR